MEDVKALLVESFEEVKDAVRKVEGRGRAGLMLGLQELGSSPAGFVGAYYMMHGNLIVMNKSPIRRITETEPDLLAPYSRHILLHEYIHSLGLADEDATRQKTLEVSAGAWGHDDVATKLAVDLRPYFPVLTYPGFGWAPEAGAPIERVDGFDRESTRGYIT